MLIRYWLVTPGWSTSWMLLARMAERTSRGVNTSSKAFDLSRMCVDWVTSAACRWLWYGISLN